MSIWKPTPISETPHIVLSQWNIYKVEDETLHFVGYNETELHGRVSSAIIEFDPITKKGKTRSGRIYQLIGNSGYNSDAEYVWKIWRHRNGVAQYSKEVL